MTVTCNNCNKGTAPKIESCVAALCPVCRHVICPRCGNAHLNIYVRIPQVYAILWCGCEGPTMLHANEQEINKGLAESQAA